MPLVARKRRSERRSPWRMIVFVLPLLLVLVIIWVVASRDDTNVAANQSTNTKATQTNGNVSPEQQTNRQTYENKEFGFTVTYAAGWNVTEGSAGEGASRIFVMNFSKSDLVTLSVMDSSLENMIRNSLSLEGELSRTIAGYPATELRGTSYKDGSPEVIYLLIRNGTEYAFRGSTREALLVAESIQFIQ